MHIRVNPTAPFTHRSRIGTWLPLKSAACIGSHILRCSHFICTDSTFQAKCFAQGHTSDALPPAVYFINKKSPRNVFYLCASPHILFGITSAKPTGASVRLTWRGNEQGSQSAVGSIEMACPLRAPCWPSAGHVEVKDCGLVHLDSPEDRACVRGLGEERAASVTVVVGCRLLSSGHTGLSPIVHDRLRTE